MAKIRRYTIDPNDIGDIWSYDKAPLYKAKSVSISKTTDGKLYIETEQKLNNYGM